jgi:PhoH-like ATPase
VHRILQELLPDSRSMHEGVELPNGGTLSVIINPYLAEPGRRSPAMDRLRASSRPHEEGQPDHRVGPLRPGAVPAADHPRHEGRQRAAQGARGRPRVGGLPERQGPEDVEEASYREIPLSIYELQRFCSEGQFELDAKRRRPLCLNEYVLLRSDEGKTMPARYYGDNVVAASRFPST